MNDPTRVTRNPRNDHAAGAIWKRKTRFLRVEAPATPDRTGVPADGAFDGPHAGLTFSPSSTPGASGSRQNFVLSRSPFRRYNPAPFPPSDDSKCLVTRTLRGRDASFTKEGLKWTTWERRNRRDADSDAD